MTDTTTLFGDDDFVETPTKAKNDYAAALRIALAAFASDDDRTRYVVKPADLGRSDDTYNAASIATRLAALLASTTHDATYRVAKGKLAGTSVVAVVKR